MTTSNERRLTELERKVAHIERQLSSLGPESGTSAIRESNVVNSSPHRDDPEVGKGENETEDAVVQRAENLLDKLLNMDPPKLISYSAAYGHIIGGYEIWRNAVHAPEVIRLARLTSHRRVGNLTIQLDTLIVGKASRRPGRGHFRTAMYTEPDWIRTFGTWSLLA